MNKPETGMQVLELHTKYIINAEKPEVGFPLSGNRYLNRDEMYEIARAFVNIAMLTGPRKAMKPGEQREEAPDNQEAQTEPAQEPTEDDVGATYDRRDE